MEFQYASRASQGARSYQEDSAAVRTLAGPERTAPAGAEGRASELTAALADGMGGHAGGALASGTACTTFLAAYVSSSGEVPARLDEAMQLANQAIAAQVDENPSLSGMGCTLIGTTFSAPGIEWVSVGDSPLFLIRGGEIVLLNEDHSLAPEIDLVDRSHRPLALHAGDVVVLASDGIQTLEHSEILRVVNAYAAEGPDAVAEGLIRTVEGARDPFQDNTTVVAVVVR